MTAGPALATLARTVSAFFVGCSRCGAMLVLANADGPGRAHRAGWLLSPSGWLCNKHTEPPSEEPGGHGEGTASSSTGCKFGFHDDEG